MTSYLEQYKSDCRVDSLFQKNTDYLVWDKTSVRLNAKHEEFLDNCLMAPIVVY